jgi:hypothetical protein
MHAIESGPECRLGRVVARADDFGTHACEELVIRLTETSLCQAAFSLTAIILTSPTADGTERVGGAVGPRKKGVISTDAQLECAKGWQRMLRKCI